MRSSPVIAGGRALRVPARPVCLGLYDVGAGDLVVPTLLVGVERHPDDPDEDDDDAEDEPDVAEERVHERELGAGGLHDADVERAITEGLAVSVGGPEVHEVREADERLEPRPAALIAGED